MWTTAVTSVDLARLQFATTSLYHFLFVPLTLGLAPLVALMQTAWHRTGNEHWLRLARFFGTLMLSSTDFGNSLTVDGAASSHYALQVMSVVALIFVPVVLGYQGWTYYVFRHRVGGGRAELPAPELAPEAGSSPAASDPTA